MAAPFSRETQELLDAADRAIEGSRGLIIQRREIVAECERKRRIQEARFAFLRETRKPK